MNPAEIALKIFGALAELTARALEDAARGDAEAMASLEADHAAIEQLVLQQAVRRKARREANDKRLEELDRKQAAAAGDPDKTPVP